MKRICGELQARLAGEGAQALRGNETAQRHLEECEDCYGVLEALARLDETLEAMPPLDAPESVVRGLMARIAGEGQERTRAPETRERSTPLVRPWFVGLVSAAAGLFLIAVAVPSLTRARISAPRRPVASPAETAADDRAIPDASSQAPQSP